MGEKLFFWYYNVVMAKETRILLTGGGTGGHIYPLLAAAQRLAGYRLRYFGDPGIYRDLLKSAGIEISAIASSKLRRYFSLANFLDFFKFIFGLIQSLWKLYWFMPDVAFSKGGPGALPVLLACRFYFIPVVIHESDAIPGLTNKISAKFARKVFLAFAAAQTHLQTKGEVATVGQPVRDDILKPKPMEEAKKSFAFNPIRPVLLVLGGSQGSAALNEFVLANITALLGRFQILHQVGYENYESHKQEWATISKDFSPLLKSSYEFVPYFDQNLSDAYDAADVVVSRAGAGAIFECAAKGKPAVLIPLPDSANGHQEANAFEAKKAGMAEVIEQQNLLSNLFLSVIDNLMSDTQKLSSMSVAARAFYKPDAATKIAEGIISLVASR